MANNPDSRDNPKSTFDLGDFIGGTPLRFARPMSVASRGQTGLVPPNVKQDDSRVFDPSRHNPGDIDTMPMLPPINSSNTANDPLSGMTVPMEPNKPNHASQAYVVGQPNFQMYQKEDTKATVMTLRRETESMDLITSNDLEPLRAITRQMYQQMKSMSNGPYSQRDLDRMGNPYGFDVIRDEKGVILEKKRRKVPRNKYGQSIGHPKGIRGSVPTLSVVNRQSGKFEESWRWSLLFDRGGISINLWNTNPVAWYLCAGTTRMQAHGPFNTVPVKFMDVINNEFAKLVSQAYHRKAMEEQIESMRKE
jgi:hypothetical protein